MTDKNFKAFLNRFQWNKQTSDDEKLLSDFVNANPKTTSGKSPYEVAQMFVGHQEKTAKQDKKAKETQMDMFFDKGLMMPLKDDDSVMPKQILRSSMFAAIKRGKRKYLNNQVVAKNHAGDILYTGAQLDQADLDVLLAIIKLLSEYTATNNVTHIKSDNGRVEYSRLLCGSKGLLKMIGRPQGKSGRQWLWASLQRLTGELCIRIDFGCGGDTYYAGSILGKRAKTDDNLLMIDVNHDFISMFGGNKFSFIDREVRKQLTGDFTKWLQGFVSTHTGQSTYSAEKLMKLSGSSTTRARDFIRQSAKPAFEQLKEQGLIKNYSLKGHLFNWYK